MKQYNFQLLFTCFLFVSTGAGKIEDYCWREYEGTIPSDALPAHELGKDKRPVYVGQALFKDKIIAGKIYANDSSIYVEYFDVEYSTGANVKILCTKQPAKFEWVSVSNTNVLQIPKKLLITGGFEPNCAAYVGRVEIDGEMNPGKVICCDGKQDCYGLYTTNKNKGSLHTNFQILRYNENIVNQTPRINTEDKIDKPEPQYGKCKKILINLFY